MSSRAPVRTVNPSRPSAGPANGAAGPVRPSGASAAGNPVRSSAGPVPAKSGVGSGLGGPAPRSMGAAPPRPGMGGAPPGARPGAGMNGAPPGARPGAGMNGAPPGARPGAGMNGAPPGARPGAGMNTGSSFTNGGSLYKGTSQRPTSMNGSGYGGGSLYGGTSQRPTSMNGSGYGGGSLYGGMGSRTGSMGGSGYGMQRPSVGGPMGSGYGGFGSMNGMNSGYGSMYGMGGPAGGSMPMGSMYGSQMGSMYGMGGPMGMPMGSMYGMGGPMGMPMGSMYGMGGPMGMSMGSMYGMGGPMGSMYGPMGHPMCMPMGSMCGPMGMPMGSMCGPMGMPMGSMYGVNSMYGMGSMYGSIIEAASRRNSFLARNDLIRASVSSTGKDKDKDKDDKKKEENKKDKDDKPTSTGSTTSTSTATKPPATSTSATEKTSTASSSTAGKTSTTPSSTAGKTSTTSSSTAGKTSTTSSSTAGKTTTSTTKDDKETPKVVGSSQASRAAPVSKAGASSGEKVKAPTDNNIHGVVVITNEAGSPASAAVKVKNATTVTNASKDDITVDEVLTHTDTSKPLESVMLDDLRRHWLGGHNSTLLLGAAKGQNAAATQIAKKFLEAAVSKVEKDGIKFDVTITMAAVKGGDEVKDLLKSGASYEKMQMTSSPIFGPAIGGLTSKEHRQSSDCAKTFEDGLKASSKPEELVLAFFVLKQIKKGTSSEETVYVSSLCFVIAGEEVSHLTGVKDKSKSEPYTLLRYAVGGASASVCLVAVTAEESRKDSVNAALDAVKSMRQVKNSAPRSGNVKHFVDFTKNELPKQKAAAEKLNDNPEKQKSAQKIVTRMEVMLKDAQELLSKPKETKPKAY